RAQRARRAGGPLWRLVDFRAGVSAPERSGLEAALEAAGLLDAWVTPDGRLDDPGLADVVLAGGEPVTGRSALDALAPVVDQGVAETIVAGLLGRIGLGCRGASPWVDFDGRFALGPLVGRGAKSCAEHIGAAAREARRAARIAELRDRIAELTVQVGGHDRAIAELDRRRDAVGAELQRLPTSDAVAAAVTGVRVVAALEAEAARAHEQAAVAARVAADDAVAADATRREHAADHGLPAPLDEPQLDGLSEAAAQLSAAAATVARAWTHAEREAQAADATAAQLANAQERLGEQDRRARDERVEADRLAAEHAARADALGASGDELRLRHEQVVTALKAARVAQRDAGEIAQAARVAAAVLDRDESARAADHDIARRAREEAGVAFGQLAAAGILELVLGEATPPDVAGATGWTFTRTLEVARSLPEELLSVRSSSGELAVEVQRGVQLLDRELVEADMSAYAISGADGLLLVRVAEGGAEQTLGAMLDALAAEIADREQILSTEERRVFNEALVEEIADHLRHRIHDVRGRVASMNAVLKRSPTAADKIVELEWLPVDDDAGTQRAALALLRRDVRHLEDGARGELVTFFRGAIETARREHGVAGDPRPMAETLMGAFDYRRWFAFGLYEHSSAGRVRLTKRRHAVGSGGEQSVLIHLPLFAAAAAMYGSSQGPRLIMLDEALSGIDDETRERVLEATVAFDLDLVMTSHELWGTYRSVPQLAIYQLHRENGTFGVHAIPFIWDGDVLREREQDELLV
ncbi:MAG: SbcC/MukB-like Walker B domain-containing protein, partial [Solirubrobacteraceae bacterium]